MRLFSGQQILLLGFLVIFPSIGLLVSRNLAYGARIVLFVGDVSIPSDGLYGIEGLCLAYAAYKVLVFLSPFSLQFSSFFSTFYPFDKFLATNLFQ